MKIDMLFSRMGEQEIKTNFLNKEVIETLIHYDEKLVLPSKIRKLVSQKISHVEMLQNSTMRNALIDAMTDDEINKLSNILEIPHTSNNREKLSKTQIRKNTPRERNLFSFFECEYKIEDPTEGTSNNVTISPVMSLFTYQRDAVDAVEQYLNSDERTALLHMPTGSGKTRTAMRIISNIFLKNNQPTTIIWVALTEELCEQAVNEFKNTWNAVGNRDVTVFRFFGDHKMDLLSEISKKHEGFIVANIKKLDCVKDQQFLTTLADEIHLVVMDEAHHAIAPTYRRVIEILKKHRKTKLLGLSATPGRTLKKNEEDGKLASFFGINKVTLKINDQNPISYLIQNKYISDPDIKIIHHDDNLTDDDKKLLVGELEISNEILVKIGKDVKRNIKIVKIIETLINNKEDPQKRIIIFLPTIQSSRDISMILSARGLDANYIDSNMSIQQRTQIIKKYKEDTNEPIILCNVMVLTAGFDAPKTSSVVIARPTKSLVLYSQMVGRAIRGIKMGGTDKCYIRIITDKSIKEFQDIVGAFEHWEDEWE